MKRNMTLRKALLWLIIAALIIYALSFLGVMFSEHYFIRKYLWLFIGGAVIVFAFSAPKIVSLFKGESKAPAPFFKTVGSMFLLVICFSRFSPKMSIPDLNYLYNNNKQAFQRIIKNTK